MTLDRYEVFDPLNDSYRSRTVEAVDHESAAESAVQDWNSEDGFLAEFKKYDVEVVGPLDCQGGYCGATRKKFEVWFQLEPVYSSREITLKNSKPNQEK